MSDVRRYYDLDPQHEWDRLDRNRTEFAVTMRAFKEYFPPPPATILDVGGGPGRYSIGLAQKGYKVILVDLSRNCLEFARKKAREAGVELAEYIHGNAVDLPFKKEQIDVILFMGPLYHLLTEKDRENAVSEAARILRQKGLIFATFVTNYAPLRWAGKYEPAWIFEHQKQCEQIITTGSVEPPLKEESFVNYAWFAHPSEVLPLMEKAGFKTVDVIACEGIVSMIDEQVNELTGKVWEMWVDTNYRLGKDSTIYGAAEHLLYIGEKI